VRTLVAIALAALPAPALAEAVVGVVPWGEEAATAEDVATAAETAAAVVQALTGEVPARMDASGSVASGCPDVECVAGLGALAGASKLVLVAVRRTDAAAAPIVRFVLVEVAPAPREVVRIETALPEARTVLEAALRPLLGGPPIVEPDIQATGSLLVETVPVGADVYLDGVLQGRTPMPSLPAVAPGRHEVIARLGGYADERVEAFVGVGEETRVQATLHPPQPVEPPEPFVPPERTERWYGWSVLIADSVSIGLAAVVDAPWLWFLGYLALPPIIHGANGNGGGAGLSIATRLLAPFLGAGLGYAVGNEDSVALFGIVGVIAAIVVDVSAYSYVKEGPRRE